MDESNEWSSFLMCSNLLHTEQEKKIRKSKRFSCELRSKYWYTNRILWVEYLLEVYKNGTCTESDYKIHFEKVANKFALLNYLHRWFVVSGKFIANSFSTINLIDCVSLRCVVNGFMLNFVGISVTGQQECWMYKIIRMFPNNNSIFHRNSLSKLNLIIRI